MIHILVSQQLQIKKLKTIFCELIDIWDLFLISFISSSLFSHVFNMNIFHNKYSDSLDFDQISKIDILDFFFFLYFILTTTVDDEVVEDF